MTDSSSPTPKVTVTRDPGARFIHFDGVAAHGVMNGAVEIELASRILIPANDRTIVEFVINGHIRCSPSAARALRSAIDDCLRMLEQPNSPQEAGPNTIN